MLLCILSLSPSVQSNHSRKCFAAAEDVKLARLVLPQPVAGRRGGRRCQNIQVATRPVEPHRTRLKIAPAGKKEGGREGRTGWQRSFCAGEPRCRSLSGRLRFCLRCCEVHRFSLLSFQLSLLPGRIQPRLRTKETLVQWCDFFFLQTAERSLSHENV